MITEIWRETDFTLSTHKICVDYVIANTDVVDERNAVVVCSSKNAWPSSIQISNIRRLAFFRSFFLSGAISLGQDLTPPVAKQTQQTQSHTMDLTWCQMCKVCLGSILHTAYRLISSAIAKHVIDTVHVIYIEYSNVHLTLMVI